MFRKGSIFSVIVDAAIFIILEVAALSMLANNGKLQNIWISKLAHNVMVQVWGTSQTISSYFRLSSQNDELAQENFNLRMKLKHYEEAISREEITKEVIIGNFKYTPAEIVKISKNKQHNYIILNKGSEDGITLNSGVITEKGAIGIIEAVSEHYSYAIAFTNHELSISSRVGKEGAVGPLSWDGIGSRSANLKEIPLHIDVQPGDTIFTSGHSSFFPADIPLGEAVKTTIVNGSTQDIKVNLFQDYRSLRYATIVNNIHGDELKQWD